MALKYGVNFSAGDISSALEKNDKRKEGIRTWSQLFGNASLGFGAQTDVITSSYSDAIRQAYMANFNQRNAIQGSGLNQGYIDQAIGMSRQDLSNTYEKYIRNYASDVNAAAENYSSEVSTRKGDLAARGENFSQLFSSAYDYLSSELYGSTMLDKSDLSNPIYALDEKGKATGEIEGYDYPRLDYLTERGLDEYYNRDSEGNVTGLKSFNELSKVLFDEDGNITEEGQRFFDHIYNAKPEGYTKKDETSVRGFDEWLSESNPELREWMMSSDEYNYTFAGTNLGSAKTMLGMESMDFKENVPDTTLLNAQRTGYNNLINKMNSGKNTSKLGDEVWYNKNEDNFVKLSKKEKNLSYNDLFSELNKKITNWSNMSFMSDVGFAKYRDATSRYITRYKSVAKDEINTFKSEITSLLGESKSNEFWEQYGNEIDTLYKRIENLEDVKKYDIAYAAGKEDIKYLSQKLQKVRELQNFGFEQKMKDLQKKLRDYINKQSINKNKSGF